MLKLILASVTTAVLTCVLIPIAHAQTTIELWSLLDRGPDNVRTQALDYVLDTFESKYPDIKVKVTVVDWQQISPMMLRAGQAGTGPDVSMLFSPFLKMQVNAGTLQPL